MQIVKKKYQRLARQCVASQRLKELVALPLLCERTWCWNVWLVDQEFGHQPGHLTQPKGGQRWYRQAFQPRCYRGIGQVTLDRVATGNGGDNTLMVGPREQFLCQPGFPDTCLTLYE
jgi:hypothetical protein